MDNHTEPTPERLAGAPPAARTLWTALVESPGTTVRELADITHLGYSTTSKILADFQKSGLAHAGTRRHCTQPAHWHADANIENRRRATPPAAVESTSARGAVNERLGRGQLRVLVADHLRNHPTPHGHTAGSIARELGRSVGAVTNALTALAADGAAACAEGQPARYSAIEHL